LNKNEAQEVPLSEFATLERGRFSHRPRNDPAYYGGQIPFIQTGDIPKSGISITEHKQTLNENGLRVSRVFKKGTIVITIAATIGEVGILQYPACFPDSLVGITPYEDRCNPVYLLFALRNLKDRLLQMAPRSAQSNLNLEILGKLMIPLPPLSDQDLLARIFSCETKRNHAETISVSKLQYLRAAISSDLLSGRKRVSV
jgi:type I restriction enzyme S subunit